jgi:hypothetical protein
MKKPSLAVVTTTVTLPATPLGTRPGFPANPTSEPAHVPGSEADGRRELERTSGGRGT